MRSSRAGPVKHLILGIDPGITTGIALLDLNSHLVLLRSSKALSKSDIVSLASSYGKVTLVATDRAQPPKLVADVARALGAKLFKQETEFPYRDKLKSVTAFLSTVKEASADEHQVTALFSALKAFKAYKNQLEEAVRELRSLDMPNNALLEDKLKANVIKGLSINRAIKSVLPTQSTPKLATQRPKASSSRGSSVLSSKSGIKTTGFRGASSAAKSEQYPRVIRHPKTVVIPSSEIQVAGGRAETPVEGSEASSLKTADIAKTVPKAWTVVKAIEVLNRKHIKEMANKGALSFGDVVYARRIGNDPEKVGMVLKEAGVPVVILEDLDDSSILQLMNEGVMPIPASYVPIVQEGDLMLVEEARIKEAAKRIESKYREMLLNLLSGL